MSEIISGKTSIFYSPPKIIFGLSSASAVAGEVKRLGGTKALIVTDRILLEANVIRPLLESLTGGEIPYSIYDGVEPDPPAPLVDEAAEKLRSEGCDFVIGIGGASSLDVAKGVSLVGTNGGEVISLIGFEQVPKRGLPKILMSTTHSAGGELSQYVIMVASKEDHSVVPIISEFAIPEVAIMDPLLTLSMPPTVTVDTSIDTFATAIEAIVASNASPFSDVFAERALELAARYLPVVWAKGSNVTARYYMSMAATMAGLAFISSSVGAVHALSYPLAGKYHLTHGRSLAAVLPHVMDFNRAGNPERYARVAELTGKGTEGLTALEASELAVEGVTDILDAVEVSYRLQDYGASQNDIETLTEEAMATAPFFEYNPRDFNERNIKEIYQAAL
ncbi:MAG: iron-containing alcohol dehydrogenase [Candidatus Abyssobacteria bacterium SURF_5]|uniref:Iron-containing alcohol dehydrogenase n=1 Tax=Abyssobacteria bacterium (strain SURF_5) TaxID=2093360 RepID=A0A3A4NAZ6_ABYX5|nr:MAG: iron-containing alcohol dehydrogenase [Candidatus Abyssubacteria bacterium SURF_5]